MAEELAEGTEEAAQLDEVRAEATEKKAARRRRKRRRKPREPGKVAPDLPDAELAGEVSEAISEEPAESEPEGDGGQPDKGRPKRRRKRPSPRKKKKTPVADEAAAEEDSAAEQPEEGRKRAERTAAKPGKSPERRDQEAEPSEGPKPSKPSHRAIPTWEEAIGMIISTNLESRAKSPDRSFSRGRGKGRGSSKGKGSREKPPEKKKKS